MAIWQIPQNLNKKKKKKIYDKTLRIIKKFLTKVFTFKYSSPKYGQLTKTHFLFREMITVLGFFFLMTIYEQTALKPFDFRIVSYLKNAIHSQMKY